MADWSKYFEPKINAVYQIKYNGTFDNGAVVLKFYDFSASFQRVLAALKNEK